jgi:2,4-dienoyl-CoA reductase-like NADH-dependent reductase (Old Yellow Enzyme family)
MARSPGGRGYRERRLAVAITATDWAKHGSEVEDAIVLANLLKQHGCNLITVCVGQTVIEDEPDYGPGFLTSCSDSIRNEARIRPLTAGHLTSADQVNTIIAAGRADLCIMDLLVGDEAVGSLSDREIARRAPRGRTSPSIQRDYKAKQIPRPGLPELGMAA